MATVFVLKDGVLVPISSASAESGTFRVVDGMVCTEVPDEEGGE